MPIKNINEIDHEKCNRCRCWRLPEQFLNKTSRKLKTCSICRARDLKNRNKNKCEHGRKKSRCTECGSSVCEHNRHTSSCKECSDPKKITIKNWIRLSLKNDKIYDRYDAANSIDKCFLEKLINDNPKCIYCDCELQYVFRKNNLATIERKDNTIGHIKSNCVIACYSCNCKRNNNYTFDEFKNKSHPDLIMKNAIENIYVKSSVIKHSINVKKWINEASPADIKKFNNVKKWILDCKKSGKHYNNTLDDFKLYCKKNNL